MTPLVEKVLAGSCVFGRAVPYWVAQPNFERSPMRLNISNGLYRLVKWEEDGNPVFPSPDTVVEVRDGIVINCSTLRTWPLARLGSERSLYGPIRNAYDYTQIRRLRRIDLARRSDGSRMTGAASGAA